MVAFSISHPNLCLILVPQFLDAMNYHVKLILVKLGWLRIRLTSSFIFVGLHLVRLAFFSIDHKVKNQHDKLSVGPVGVFLNY